MHPPTPRLRRGGRELTRINIHHEAHEVHEVADFWLLAPDSCFSPSSLTEPQRTAATQDIEAFPYRITILFDMDAAEA